MSWIERVEVPRCGWCCSFADYDVSISALDARIGLFALGQSFVLVGSMIGLLYKLNQTYRSSYQAHQRPMQRLLRAAATATPRREGEVEDGRSLRTRLLGKEGGEVTEEGAITTPSRKVHASRKHPGTGSKTPLVLPAYYTYTQCAALLFIVEALLYLPANSTAVYWLRFVSFSACAFFDNFVLVFLCDPAAPHSAWRASIVSAALSAGYLVYVSFIPTSASCVWCGVHYPKPGIEYPYLLASFLYATVAIASFRHARSNPPHRHVLRTCGLAIRPAAAVWAAVLATAYGLAAVGTLILDQVGSDAGYCLSNLAILVYSITYAPFLYRTFVSDTKFCAKQETLQVLHRLRSPPSVDTAAGDSGDGPSRMNLTRRGGTAGSGASLGLAVVSATSSARGSGALGNTARTREAGAGAGGGSDGGGRDGVVRTAGIGTLRPGSKAAEHLRKLLQDPSINIIPSRDVKPVREVGSGGYGSVHVAEWQGAVVAVKRLFVTGGTSADIAATPLAEFLQEARLLSQLRHPNIVLLLGLCIDSGHHALVTEYVPGGSVFDYIGHERRRAVTRRLADPNAPPGVPFPVAARMLVQAARGMAYLHSRSPPVIHRDLKSANLLFNTRSSVVKVCDFGLSRCKEATAAMTAIGTCQWSAPEVLRRDAYSEKADVWSFAVIIWELCALDLPFRGLSAIRVAAGVAFESLRLVLPPGSPAPLAALMDKCMQEDPRARPDFAAIAAALEPHVVSTETANHS